MKGSDLIAIGQLSQRTGLAVSAIRFYEAKGLVRPYRSAGGQRQFRRSDIRRLSFVIAAQKLGFSIGEIAEQLSQLPEQRTPTKADWARISKSFRASLDRRIKALQELRDKLDGCIGCGCLSLQKCKLYNPGDDAARHGAGPRYLMGDRPTKQPGKEGR